jgi:hypothetical protein
VAPNNTDRRRFLLATGLTLLALPALWWANQATDTGAPKVATAGVSVGNTTLDPAPPTPIDAATAAVDADAIDGAIVVEVTPPTPTAALLDADPDPPVFLGGPRAPGAVAAPNVVVQTTLEAVTIVTEATYQSSITPVDSCLAFGVQTGATLTIVNLDNGRSVTCTAVRTFVDRAEGVVLHTDTFGKIADLTDAPVPVEITQ